MNAHPAPRPLVRLVLALLLAVSTGVAVSSSPTIAQEDPDDPFPAPQYLIHITGHGTTDGDRKDDAYILHPNAPDAQGSLLVADGSGGTYGYSTDSFSGPYATPGEVCAAAAGKVPIDLMITSFSGTAESVTCSAYLPDTVPDTDPEASDPDTTDTVDDSTATTDTLPEPAPACNVRGRVVDLFGAPVPGIHISLRAGGLSFETSTLDDGTYEFAEIGDDPGGGVFDSRVDTVTVGLVAEEWAHTPQRYIVYYRQRGAVLRTDPFLIPDDGDCERDFDMRSISPAYVSVGPPLNEWPDLTQIYQGIHHAWALADLLGIQLAYGLPLQILAFCDTGNCSADAAFFTGSMSDGSQIVDRPTISFGVSASRLLSLDWPDNREYHEFGHYVMATAFNGMPNHPGDRNHVGYANPSSTDSWTEGFAEFWASMVVKYIDHRQRSEIYQWNRGHLPSNSPNAPPVPGSNLLDVWPARVDEEFAVASLLYTLENLSVADAPAAPRAPRTLKVAGYTETTDPHWGRLLVGNVVNETPDGASLGTSVGAVFYDAAGSIIRSVWGSSVPANLGANGGKGVFVLPVPKDLVYSDVSVLVREGAPPPPDPVVPPLDVSLAELWAAIVGYPSPKPLSGGHVLDVDDLYQALKASFGGRGDVVDGLDTIDRLFVERGLFDDVDGDGRFVPGDRIGGTSHPDYGDQETCVAEGYFGCSPYRVPRNGFVGPTAGLATVTVEAAGGPVPATQVYVQVTYPAPREHESYGYVVVPDASGSVELAVPPPGTGAEVVLIALADGHLPAVLGSVVADTFWDDATAHAGGPFLAFGATLQPGEFEIPDGAGVAVVASPAEAPAASRGDTSDDPGTGPVIVVVGVLAAAATVGRRIGRTRPT